MDTTFEQQSSALDEATEELHKLRLLNQQAREKLAALAQEHPTAGINGDNKEGGSLHKVGGVLAAPSHNLHASLTSLLLSVERLIDLDAREVPGVNEVIERQIQHLSILVDDLVGLSLDNLDQPDDEEPDSMLRPTLPWP